MGVKTIVVEARATDIGGRLWRGRTNPLPSAPASKLFFCKKKVGVGINMEYTCT